MRQYTLPWPPSINHYWRRVGPRYFVSPMGQKFAKEVISRIGDVSPMKGRVGVTVLLHPPDYRVRDIDNVLKPLLDSLQKAGVYENDNQVDAIAIVRGSVGKDYSNNSKGCCEVTVCRASAMFPP